MSNFSRWKDNSTQPFFVYLHTLQYGKDKHLFIVNTAVERFSIRYIGKKEDIIHDFDVRSTTENYVIHVIA